jgi:acyl carrier protein
MKRAAWLALLGLAACLAEVTPAVKRPEPAAEASRAPKPGRPVPSLDAGPFRNTENVEARIRAIISDQLGVSGDNITFATSLTRDLGADSIRLVELSMALEDEFLLVIPDQVSAGFRTVGDLVVYVNAHAK